MISDGRRAGVENFYLDESIDVSICPQYVMPFLRKALLPGVIKGLVFG